MKRLWLALLLSNCWGSCPNCPGWPATPEAGTERVVAANLTHCIQNNPCVMIHSCFLKAEAACLDAGLERICGQMEAEGTCGEQVK